MSFLKKLFGGGGSADGDNDNRGLSGASVEHEGYIITPMPMKEGPQYRLAGTIAREVDGEEKIHEFIRADLFSSVDECSEACIRKAKQVIREQGLNLFR